MVEIPGTCYLVGGAVRDQLLGRLIHERDWVVVGSNSEKMQAAGFKQIGKAFPVFLHPETCEEYALARKELKSGLGHTGFVANAESNVSLHEDLARRDLTINAMALDENDQLIDPYGGEADLERGLLRHVSPAFCEDPLRCFRVARFAAHFEGFSVHSSTIELLKSMTNTLYELPAERVWQEWIKGLGGQHPVRFYEVLKESELLEPWFSMLDVEQLINRHKTRTFSKEGAFGLVGWCHSKETNEEFFGLLKAPRKVQQLAERVSLYGKLIASFPRVESNVLLDTLETLRAFHESSGFVELVSVIKEIENFEAEALIHLIQELRTVDVKELGGESASREIRRQRLERLEAEVQQLQRS